MIVKHRYLSFLLLCCYSAGAQKQHVGTSPSGSSCVSSQLLTDLSKGTGASLLRAFGYDLREPWTCTKIESSWATGATILRFQKLTAQTDDQTAFSVVKVSSLQHIWVIPTETGMLEVSHSETDPHNMAAFNALLRLRKGPVDAAGWLEAGKLYMAILGHKDVMPFKAQPADAYPCTSHECSVSFSDRPIVESEPYNKWTLAFTARVQGKPVTLTDVSRETVQPGK
jgi:hypothetical protein